VSANFDTTACHSGVRHDVQGERPGQLISAEVTPTPLGMPELTIADIEQVEADSLNYRYE
jgi:hypothetical protein